MDLHFLVDSGADTAAVDRVTVDAWVPCLSCIQNRFVSDYKLYVANGSQIETFVTEALNLDLELRRDF